MPHFAYQLFPKVVDDVSPFSHDPKSLLKFSGSSFLSSFQLAGTLTS